MGTAWFLASSTSGIQSDVIQLIIVSSGVIIASLVVYTATRKRYATQWIVYGCIVFIVIAASIVLVSEAIDTIVTASGYSK